MPSIDIMAWLDTRRNFLGKSGYNRGIIGCPGQSYYYPENAVGCPAMVCRAPNGPDGYIKHISSNLEDDIHCNIC
eukprot:gene1021-1869_t